jgi:hypothetical protein
MKHTPGPSDSECAGAFKGVPRRILRIGKSYNQKSLGRDCEGGREGVMKLTYNLAMAAAWDEGNRSMKKAGRKKWNDEDWIAAAKKANELLDMMEAQWAAA